MEKQEKPKKATKVTSEKVVKEDEIGNDMKIPECSAVPFEKKDNYHSATNIHIPFKEKLFNLAIDMTEISNTCFKLDGFNDHQNYSYTSAMQYKTLFNQCLVKNRLLSKLDDLMCTIGDSFRSEKMTLILYQGILTIEDVDSDEKKTYLVWSEGADNGDKGISKAKTLALKDMIKANFLISDKDDDIDKPTYVGNSSKSKFVTSSQKVEITNGIVTNNPSITPENKELIIQRINALRKAKNDDTYGQATLDNLDTMTNTDAIVKLTTLELRANEYNITV